MSYRPTVLWLIALALWSLTGALVVLRVVLPWDGAWISITDPQYGQVFVIAVDEPIALKPGDRILALDGRALNDWLLDALSHPALTPDWHSGQTVTYRVQRGDSQLDVPLTLQPGALRWPLRRWGVLVCSMVFQFVAVWVFLKRPREEAAAIVFLTATIFASYALARSLETQLGEAINGLRLWLFLTSAAGVLTLFGVTVVHLTLVFPQRHPLVTRRPWLIPVIYAVPFAAIIMAGASQWPALGNIEPWSRAIGSTARIIEGCLLLAGSVFAVTNYRSGHDPIKRQQAKWVVLSIAITFTWTVISYNVPTALIDAHLWQGLDQNVSMLVGNVSGLMATTIPIALAIAILRYRLFDIDLIINRTLVYGALTLFVVGAYVLIVGYIGTALEASGNLWLSLLTTGLIAVLFQPIRARVQQLVNRWMYGDRDDPYAVLSRLGQRLEELIAPEAVLPTLVESVAHALKLPYVAIALRDVDQSEFKLAATYGQSVADNLYTLPLMYQADQIGQIIVASRTLHEVFTPAERHLLTDLARQAGLAVHGVRLTFELRRSREQLVTAREEERRRLRRDLHDGVGPTLAALSLKAGTLRHIIPNDPMAATTQAIELRDQLRSVIADIRRAVYDLRPPALDELGLVQAIREQAAQYSAQGLQVTVEAPDQLPALSAAVEVAAYRITLEALTNVARHAEARQCVVRLTSNGALYLEVSDDGQGIAEPHRTGVGHMSMRERASELNGTYLIEPNPTGGTVIKVSLPLSERAGFQSH